VERKINKQEREGYDRDKRPEIEKLKTEIAVTETRKKLKQRKNGKAVRISMK